MSQGLRVLTKVLHGPSQREAPSRRRRRPGASDPQARTPVYVHIHGAVLARRNTRRKAGAGIAFTDEVNEDISLRVPDDWGNSSQSAEILAALIAVRTVRKDADLTLISTHDYIMKAMNTHLRKWENVGWVGVKNRLPLQCLAAEIRARAGNTYFGIVSANTDVNARKAKLLAIQGYGNSGVAKVDLTAPPGYSSTGMALVGTRQKMFYRAIREIKDGKRRPRPATTKQVDLTLDAVFQDYGRDASEPELWMSIRKKDFSRQVRNFMYRAMHDSFQIGKYWRNIPGFEERVNCPECGELEDMEHILLRCKANNVVDATWGAAKELWATTGDTWPINSLGSLLGCGLASFHTGDKNMRQAKQRLFMIIISETTFHLWKMRNARIIGQTPPSARESINKWHFAINKRVEIDFILAGRPKKGPQASLSPRIVDQTWLPILLDARIMHEGWIRRPRGLVGKEPPDKVSSSPTLPSARCA
ncbi:hypothetical protein GGX14DRAFT_364814 [Mycena pura]|uniref:RNase H type-1 domain-containing protein n=1 Tax=Mycena pura TaxID=153505 RepID=A0AAD6VCP2_9AGAR|nr:hypothetical protein GGX14DRAFT_364814 [Mycena pura]